MVCPQCGNNAEGAFCSRCGAPLVQQQPPAPMYAMPPQPMYIPRVQQHLRMLGILWCVYGGYRALTGIFGALFLAGITSHRFGPWGRPGMFPFDGMPFMQGIAGFVAVTTVVFAALSFFVGFGLINRKPWGRTLAISIAILQLIKIPFGTALGIYTLWVLAPAASAVEYNAIADHS